MKELKISKLYFSMYLYVFVFIETYLTMSCIAWRQLTNPSKIVEHFKQSYFTYLWQRDKPQLYSMYLGWEMKFQSHTFFGTPCRPLHSLLIASLLIPFFLLSLSILDFVYWFLVNLYASLFADLYLLSCFTSIQGFFPFSYSVSCMLLLCVQCCVHISSQAVDVIFYSRQKLPCI